MSDISNFLRDCGASITSLANSDLMAFERRWLEGFASNVKSRHGTWIYRGYRWHGFSYNLEPCKKGSKAIAAYLDQWPTRYVVFDEDLTESLVCESELYPDLSPLGLDVYVSHANLKWTMVFTHEQPELGPYFAMRRSS